MALDDYTLDLEMIKYLKRTQGLQCKVRSKETINQPSSLEIACYPLYKTHWLLFVSVHENTISSWVVTYIHGCTNEHTFSIKSTRFNPCFGHKLAKVGIKSFRFDRECVLIYASMDVNYSYPAGIVFHEQTQIPYTMKLSRQKTFAVFGTTEKVFHTKIS